MQKTNFKDSMHVRVYYEDTDAGGVVYHSKYLNFAERARSEYLRKLKLDQAEIKNIYNIQFVVKSLKVDYIGFCSLDDKIKIETYIVNMNRAVMLFKHTFFHKNKIINHINAKICCIKETGKVARMPKSLYDKIIIKG